jgi:hypothetical protein
MDRVDWEGTRGDRRGEGESMDRVRCEVRGGDNEWTG